MSHSSRRTSLLQTTLMITAALFCGTTDGRVCYDFAVVKNATDFFDMSTDVREMQCDTAFEIGEVAGADYCDFASRDALFDHCAYSALAIYDNEGNISSVLFEGGCYLDRTYNYCKKLMQNLNSSTEPMRVEFCDICFTDNCNNPYDIHRNILNVGHHLDKAKSSFVVSDGSQDSINVGNRKNFEDMKQQQHEFSKPKGELRSYGKKRALLSIVSIASLLFIATTV